MLFHFHSWSKARNSPAPNATARIDCRAIQPPCTTSLAAGRSPSVVVVGVVVVVVVERLS